MESEQKVSYDSKRNSAEASAVQEQNAGDTSHRHPPTRTCIRANQATPPSPLVVDPVAPPKYRGKQKEAKSEKLPHIKIIFDLCIQLTVYQFLCEWPAAVRMMFFLNSLVPLNARAKSQPKSQQLTEATLILQFAFTQPMQFIQSILDCHWRPCLECGLEFPWTPRAARCCRYHLF